MYRKIKLFSAVFVAILLALVCWSLVLMCDRSVPIDVEADDHCFLILSDTGADGAPIAREVAAVADSIASIIPIQFVVHLGDLFHDDGLRSLADSAHIDSNYRTLYSARLRALPWYSMLGNHEYRGNTAAALTLVQGNAAARRGSFYSKLLTYGESDSLRLLFLDTSPFVSKYYESAHYRMPDTEHLVRENHWLDSIAHDRSTIPFLVFGHHPIRTSDLGHGNNRDLGRAVDPLFRRHASRVYFSGHTHKFDHLVQYGVNYLSVGTGGRSGRFPTPWIGTQYVSSHEGLALCVLRGSILTVYFIGRSGDVIYHTAIPLTTISSDHV